MSESIKSEAVEKSLDEIEGSECLVSPARLRPSEATRVVSVFYDMVGGMDGDEIDFQSMAPVLDMVEDKYLADADLYQSIYAERGLTAILELVAAWAGEMVAAKH